jgi:hypothetical protein
MERIKVANAKTTMDLRIDISLFVGLFTWPPPQQLGVRKQIDLAFSSKARPPMGTIAAFDFADVGTLRWQLVRQSILFSAGPAGARYLIPDWYALACNACEKLAQAPRTCSVVR